MAKSIAAAIRKKMNQRERLMQQVRQLDIELEALQAAERIGSVRK